MLRLLSVKRGAALAVVPLGCLALVAACESETGGLWGGTGKDDRDDGGSSGSSGSSGVSSGGSSSSSSGKSSSSSSSSSGSSGTNYNETTLVTLDTECQGVKGLTGNAALAFGVTDATATLNYYTATVLTDAGGFTIAGSSSLTVQVTRPASPVALCFPPIPNDPELGSVGPRVGIRGLTLKYQTADGKFAETLDAVIMLGSSNGQVGFPFIKAAVLKSNLKGSYDPNTLQPGTYTGAGYVIHVGGTNAATYSLVGLVADGAKAVDRSRGLLNTGGFAVAQTQ